MKEIVIVTLIAVALLATYSLGIGTGQNFACRDYKVLVQPWSDKLMHQAGSEL